MIQAALLAVATPVACGICTYWMLTLMFPATAAWIVVFTVWFVALSVLRTVLRTPVRGVPGVWFAVPLVVTCFFAGATVLGPLIAIWIPWCCVAGTRALARWPEDRPRVRLARDGAKALAAIAIVFLATTWIYFEWRESRRTPVERVLAVRYPLAYDAKLKRIRPGDAAACADVERIFLGTTWSPNLHRALEHLERVCEAAEVDRFLASVASGETPSSLDEHKRLARERSDNRYHRSLVDPAP